MKFIIKKFSIGCLFIVCLTNTLIAYDIGVYLSPKFLLEIEDSGIRKPNDDKKIYKTYM